MEMVNKEKIAQLKNEIKLLQEKLEETIKNDKEGINKGLALSISKELDELIVEYYNNDITSNKHL